MQFYGSESGFEILGVSAHAFQPTAYWPQLKSNYTHKIADLAESSRHLPGLFMAFKPELVINCAAQADVMEAEADPNAAAALNTELPKNLAGICRDTGARFIHVSTDAVFDGKSSRPHSVTDSPNPVHTYGRSKHQGEILTAKTNPQALILRTNLVGFRDRGKPTFGEWLCNALQKAEPIKLFTDFVTNPIHVRDFTRLSNDLVNANAKGIYHLGCSDPVSKFDFGQMLASELNLSMQNVTKAKMSETPLQPPRSPNLSLDMSETEKILKTSLPQAKDAARQLAADFRLRLQKENAHAAR